MSSTTIIERRVIVRDALTQPSAASKAVGHGSAWCQCGSPSCAGGRTGGAWLNEPAEPDVVPSPRDARRLRGPGRGDGAGAGPAR
ncbi:MAG: hypothetical protein ABSA93_24595 [Streptosporangiaceae bacterium]